MRQPALLSIFILGAHSIVLPRADVCDSKNQFTTGDAKKDGDLWKNTKAGDLLSKILDKGTGNWTDRFFQETVAGGTQGGSTFDCANFPTTNCPPPGTSACTGYKPHEAFYLHTAISNYYGAYFKLHEKLQDAAIIDISTTSKTITDLYGPPPEDKGPDLFAILIGSFIFSTMIPGASDALKGFANGMIAALNFAAGGAKTAPEATDPKAFQLSLNDQLGKMFKILSGSVDKGIKQILGGDITKIDGKDGKQFLLDQFSSGIWVDKNTVGPLIDGIIKRYSAYMQDAMVVAAFNHHDPPYHLYIRNPGSKGQGEKNKMDAGQCRNRPGAIWDDKLGCAQFAKAGKAPMTGTTYTPFDDNDMSKANKVIGDYGAAVRNAMDCLMAGTKDNKGIVPTGTADFSKNNAWDTSNPSNYYPKCFWNIQRAFHGGDDLIDPPK